LIKLGHVALDGTKVGANASKHKAMSYRRMKQEIARLEGEVEQLLTRAEAIDTEEDTLYGAGKRRNEYPLAVLWRCVIAKFVYQINTYAELIRERERNGSRKRISDPDAAWGAGGKSKSGSNKGMEYWLGYLGYLVVDCESELPVAFDLRPANESETKRLQPTLEHLRRRHPQLAGRIAAVMADRSYGIATETGAGPTDSPSGHLTEVGAGPTAVTADGPLCVDAADDGKNRAKNRADSVPSSSITTRMPLQATRATTTSVYSCSAA